MTKRVSLLQSVRKCAIMKAYPIRDEKNTKETRIRKMTKHELGKELNAIMREIEATAKTNLWKAVAGTKTEADAEKLDALHARKNAILSAMLNA